MKISYFCLKNFDGKVFTPTILIKYLYELVRYGYYKFSQMDVSIKEKLDKEEKLTDEEINKLMVDNPQACGFPGRVMTQIRALKDEGFLQVDKIEGYNKISITKLGYALIENKEYPTDIYAKAMIGLHAYNPTRKALYNRSRPFLNTIFVINEVNTLWWEKGHKTKGITKLEFGAFVLSMKDCDYKKVAYEIIKYREENQYEVNQSYIEDYCYNKLGLIKGNFKNICNEYPDEVFRKFEMTGLLVKRSFYKYTFYDFSTYNLEKVRSLLEKYSDYSFQDFATKEAYYSFIGNIKLPWLDNIQKRIAIAKNKAEQLGVEITDFSNILEVEEYLDNKFYTNILVETIKNVDLDLLKKELLILSGTEKTNSIYQAIAEPLRLEYLLALVLGKQFGIIGLVSNIIYNEDGFPLHHAPSKRADIVYQYLNLVFLLEPTMIRNSSQMLNAETTGICEHLKQEEAKSNKEYRMMMIAPLISSRVVRFFRFEAIDEDMKIIPITIDVFVEIMNIATNVNQFKDEFERYLHTLKNNNPEFYTDKVNNVRAIV